MTAKKKQGWEIGQGKFSEPAKLNNAPGDDPSAKGKEIGKQVDEDYPVHGGRHS